MNDGVRVLWMRGGTSKGAYFLADDLPDDLGPFLLRVFGSPDPRQIDGIGGGDPLTSKVAVLSKSNRADADVDYHFYQVFVDEARNSDAQGCGNILAGVGPAAIERGIVPVTGETTDVRIHMVNTGEIATARVQTPNGRVTYRGDAAIDGVPGTAAPIGLMFDRLAGSMCGALLPTGNAVDVIDGVACTMIDNGMPIVVMQAAEFGFIGTETRDALDAAQDARARIETIRLKAGPMMGLGDVTEKSVPKMTLVSAPTQGGVIRAQSYIPKRAHASIGVFAAVSVGTACTLPNTPAAALAQLPADGRFTIEHPSGQVEVAFEFDSTGTIKSAGITRTARKLMDGVVF